MRHMLWFSVLLVSGTLAVQAGDSLGPQPFRAPIERASFTHATSYDSLQGFLRDIAASPLVRLDTLARTREGRAVMVVRTTSSGPDTGSQRLRIMLFAQQHGDEPSGKEALTMLLAKCASGEISTEYPDIEICIVPQMNPDGSERKQRRTSDGIDLNRSHLVLNSPETAALHELFYSWLPEVTLDLHEYGPYSRSWSDKGYIKRGDVQLGMLTNLNSSKALRKYQHDSVYTFIAGRMARTPYTFHEYIVGSPSDRIRHSTTEINDGRQSFGILNTLSFIQEGRGGKSLDDELERRSRSQLASIEALLSYCNLHSQEIRDLVRSARERLENAIGRDFALRMEHIPGGGELRIPVRLVPSDVDTVLSVAPYHDLVHAVASTAVPRGYVVPRSEQSIIDLLRRHHVKMDTLTETQLVRVEMFLVDSLSVDVLEEDSLPRPIVRTIDTTLALQPGDVGVSTEQWHAMFLPTMLEPESMWGLMKYEMFSALLRRNPYPVYRLP